MRLNYEGRQYMKVLNSDLARAALQRERARNRSDNARHQRKCHLCGFEYTNRRYGGNPDCPECVERHERLKRQNRDYKRAERARHPRCKEVTTYGRICNARGKVEVLMDGQWEWCCLLHVRKYEKEGYEIRTPDDGRRSRTHPPATDSLVETVAARERARADVQPRHASNGARSRKSSTDL